MNLQRLKELAQRVNYQDFSVNHPGYGVVSSDGTFADCLGMDEATFIYAANPSVVLALIGKLEAAERERDEFRESFNSNESEKQTLFHQKDMLLTANINIGKNLKQAELDRDEYAEGERLTAVKNVELQDEIYGLKAELARRDAAAAASELPSDELSRLRKWVKCVEAERDKAISWHSSLLKKHDKLQADIARRDAVSFEMKVHYSGIGKSGPWLKLNDQRSYEKLKLRHSGDADYEFRELYTAAPPGVLPPEMKPEPEKYDVIDHGFIAGYNQCRADALALGAQPQKPVVLPCLVDDLHGVGGVMSADDVLSSLDAAGIPYEVKP